MNNYGYYKHFSLLTMSSMRGPLTGTKYLGGRLDESEPGSRGRVLKNLLAIKTIRELEDAEILGYMEAERKLLGHFGSRHPFSIEDINLIHKLFLGRIYPWAGTFRNVNLSKGGFTFATAFAIPSAMRDLERYALAKNTPCGGSNLFAVAEKIAIVHAELLLIHPYREGNGRTARLLATLMAYQAGLPGIDFGFIGSRGKQFEAYVGAIQAGVEGVASRAKISGEHVMRGLVAWLVLARASHLRYGRMSQHGARSSLRGSHHREDTYWISEVTCRCS
jgi:cell filamentation protein